MFSKLIETAVEKALDRRTVRPDKKLELAGYQPLKDIMGKLYEWLLIPFNGSEILVEIRYPRSTQLPEYDKLFSTLGENKTPRKLSRKEKIDLLNMREECCRAVLNRPTFEELEQAIHGYDNVLANKRKLLKELEWKLSKVKGSERAELQRQFDAAELFAGFVLPDDTMSVLTNIALGADITDMRKITKEKLIIAYNKARLYNGKPSDYLPGLFPEGDRQNIDDYATVFGVEEEIKNIKNRGK